MSRRRSLLAGAWLVSTIASYRLGAESATDREDAPIMPIAVSDVTRSAPASGPQQQDSRSTTMTPAEWVVRGVLAKHVDEDNPRNRNQRAYVAGGAESIAVGQVALQAVGPNRVVFSQYPGAGAPLRTFGIEVDGPQ